MQTLHRARDRLVGERTSLINQLRAILLERGSVVPQGKKKLERYLATLMDEHDDCGLSLRMRTLIADMIAQWHELIDASPISMQSSYPGPERTRMRDD